MQCVDVVETNAFAEEHTEFCTGNFREKDADGSDEGVFVCAGDVGGGWCTAVVVVGKERLIIGFPRGYG